ncbi:hypothetical protein [Streptomyces carpinensis]|uniref:Uncharacterized protein n=1 Tax=Streptomyces carpinensis TaxID=66369 RepID=A0ABV1VX21_9ACTN|nr:hypothetical protein [Streptomyces carpinensis]
MTRAQRSMAQDSGRGAGRAIDDVLRCLDAAPQALPRRRSGRSTGRRRPVSAGPRTRARAVVVRPARRASSKFPGYGRRFPDLCRDCFPAAADLQPFRVPGRVAGIVADGVRPPPKPGRG